jgi:hypothetical protein
MDWLASICNPARFGRDTDLLSPPEGHDPQAEKQHGMGNLGDVNRFTGELIVEDRSDLQRPSGFPASALPAVCMLEYLKWSAYNPRLPRLDPVVRDPVQKQHSMRLFRGLSHLFISLSRLAADMDLGRPEDPVNVEQVKAALAGLHQTLSTTLDAPELGAECKALLRDLSAQDPGPATDRDLSRRVEALADRLDEAFPQFMETLFAPEFEVWRRWLRDHPPATASSSSDGEEGVHAKGKQRAVD